MNMLLFLILSFLAARLAETLEPRLRPAGGKLALSLYLTAIQPCVLDLLHPCATDLRCRPFGLLIAKQEDSCKGAAPFLP